MRVLFFLALFSLALMGDVLILDDDTCEDAIKNNNVIMVKFFARMDIDQFKCEATD